MYDRAPREFRWEAPETGAARPRTLQQMGATLLAEAPAGEPAPSDGALIAAAAGGAGDAFAALVERYERAVYHLALRTLRDVEDAKDAAQETWVKAYRALGGFRPGARFSTWILTICYRVCCDRLAQRRRRSDADVPDLADPGAGPERAYELADDAARLRRAVDALPEKYRVAITLFHLEGNHYEEIAAILGLPLGTVKTHLFRAKELLRTMLTESP
jgi:RNA polymerase sigma-70 factor (ECF subfamily)